jgi:hypothetical protein
MLVPLSKASHIEVTMPTTDSTEFARLAIASASRRPCEYL